jgi:catechol 2,3-dioxygenase-like lactoylglutathione lyase family enzyme
MSTVSVRYIVNDIDAAVDFYTTSLGFKVQLHPNDLFAMLVRGDLRLVLVKPVGPGGPAGGGGPMPDGTMQEPGGWNRFSVEVADIEASIEKLRENGARFRNTTVTGTGGKQILIEDPSGNPVELFEPILPEARLSRPLCLGVVAEALDEAAEHPALVRQRRPRRRGLGALPADGLVVVSPRDGVHHLGLVERVRAGNLRHEADQIAVQQDFGFQAGGALGAPDGLAPAARGHLHRVRVDPGLPQVRIDAQVPERVGDPAGTILVHDRQVTQHTSLW